MKSTSTFFQWLYEKFSSVMKIETLRKHAAVNDNTAGTYKSPLLA